MFIIFKMILRNLFIVVLASLISLNFMSCSRDKLNSQDALNNFINYRFTKDQDFSKILSMTSGSLKNDLSLLNDDLKKQFLDMNNYSKKEFRIISTQCNDNTCYITYYLKYTKISTESKKPEDDISVKKMATLVLDEKEWKISSVDFINMEVDSLVELKK